MNTIALHKDLVLEGVLVRYYGPHHIVMRTVAGDVLVPATVRLDSLFKQYFEPRAAGGSALSRRARRRRWIKISGFKKVALPNGNSLTTFDLRAMPAIPFGVAGTLRRQKRRL